MCKVDAGAFIHICQWCVQLACHKDRHQACSQVHGATARGGIPYFAGTIVIYPTTSHRANPGALPWVLGWRSHIQAAILCCCRVHLPLLVNERDHLCGCQATAGMLFHLPEIAEYHMLSKEILPSTKVQNNAIPLMQPNDSSVTYPTT